MTKADLKKVDRKSLEARAVESLEEAILIGRLPLGARLTEMQLSEDLGASRGTVRSALTKLSASGLIVQRPYAAWEVINFSAQDIWELFTLRASLEGLGIRFAIERSGQTGRDAVGAAYETLAQSCADGSVAAIAAADLAFHKAIIAQAGHSLLKEHFERVEMRVQMIISSSNALISSAAEILRQHEPIALAFAAQDIPRAVAALEKHILGEGESLVASKHSKSPG